MAKMMLTTRCQQESMTVWRSTTMANGALRTIASDSSMMASIYRNSVVQLMYELTFCVMTVRWCFIVRPATQVNEC